MKNFYPLKCLYNISKKNRKIIAIEQSDVTYSYKEFWAMISNMSEKILEKKNNPLVAIVGKKNILSYVSIFSVLNSGGTYIPISSKLPFERILKIIKLSKPSIIICETSILKKLKNCFSKKIFFTEKNLSKKPYKTKIIPKRINNLAYIIFTSGSTGEPKGVCISRKSLDHYVKWLNTKFKILIGKKCSQFSEISFDLSVADIFGTLCSGGTLCSVDSIFYNLFPGRFIKDKKINYLVCVPSLIDIISNSGDLNKSNFKSLNKIFFCGEPLLNHQAKSLYKVKKNLEIINTYGPTEATVSCTYKKVKYKDLKNLSRPSISIGKPIKGMKLELEYNSKKSKKKGEIIISGVQVGEGYLDKINNKNKFILRKKLANSFRTGDYVEVFNGEIYFKNRIDNQIKIKGHRIELDEINYHLRTYGLNNVATIIYNQKIICFISAKGQLNRKSIIKYLKKKIPDYMIPSYLYSINKIPINQNGKVDNKYLLSLTKKKINEKK
jgi:D-alanine--poly(phosphoribitol) ligase subunit 1|tara:strand:- start:1261 stop:2745 length:1485 start_codon:yes stop_codon:yes gene_type:complete